MVMTYRDMVSLCSARLDKIKQYDSIYGNDKSSSGSGGGRIMQVILPEFVDYPQHLHALQDNSYQ